MRWWRRQQREQDLERELRSDLELEADEQRESGLSPEEARNAAHRAGDGTAQEHTDAGRHEKRVEPFPDWLPRGLKLPSREAALRQLGAELAALLLR